MATAVEPDWLVSTIQIADLLGIGPRHVRKLVNAGMPQHSRGKYHAPTCLQWYIEKKTGDESVEKTDQRTKLLKAQTEKTETEARLLKAQLLDADVVDTLLYELATLVATRIDAIEPRLSRQMAPDLRTEFRVELKALRSDIANHVENHARTRDSSRDHPAAA